MKNRDWTLLPEARQIRGRGKYAGSIISPFSNRRKSGAHHESRKLVFRRGARRALYERPKKEIFVIKDIAAPAIEVHTVDDLDGFQTGKVVPIVGAHFVNDIYTAAIAPLLPVFIEKFRLSLTQAGFLTAIYQLPAIINPLIGYLADKKSIRYFVIFAPAVTGDDDQSFGFCAQLLGDAATVLRLWDQCGCLPRSGACPGRPAYPARKLAWG